MLTPGNERARPRIITIAAATGVVALVAWLATRQSGQPLLAAAIAAMQDWPSTVAAAARAFAVATSEWLAAGMADYPVAVSAVAGGTVVPFLACVTAVGRWRRRRLAIAALRRARAPARLIPRLLSDARLVIERGDEEKAFRIGELCRIGSSDDCDIVVSEAGLADIHAVVWRQDDGGFEIMDVAGAAGRGMALNGRPVTQARLADADVIAFGAIRLVFRQRQAGEVFDDPATGGRGQALAGTSRPLGDGAIAGPMRGDAGGAASAHAYVPAQPRRSAARSEIHMEGDRP